jgi:hypothetical protein
MPTKSQWTTIAITAVIVLMLAPRIRQLPLVNKLPTV